MCIHCIGTVPSHPNCTLISMLWRLQCQPCAHYPTISYSLTFLHYPLSVISLERKKEKKTLTQRVFQTFHLLQQIIPHYPNQIASPWLRKQQIQYRLGSSLVNVAKFFICRKQQGWQIKVLETACVYKECKTNLFILSHLNFQAHMSLCISSVCE